MAATHAHPKWSLTQETFDGLLNCLSADRDEAAEKYLEVRRYLLRFFEWRGCQFPEDHADETLNRVARRVSEGEQIQNPTAYIVGVARLLLLEVLKTRARESQALSEMAHMNVEAEDSSQSEARTECLQHCLQKLPADNRELILQYYQGDKSEKIANRKELTERMRVSVNTLRMRALRVRERLQECVEKCLQA